MVGVRNGIREVCYVLERRSLRAVLRMDLFPYLDLSYTHNSY